MPDRANPHQQRRPQTVGIAFTLALVFACFTLASTSYLAWLYRLMAIAPEASIEAITMVGGYAFQALGIGFMCALMRGRPALTGRLPFITAIALHFA